MSEFARRYPFSSEAKALLQNEPIHAYEALLGPAYSSVKKTLEEFYFPKSAEPGNEVLQFAAAMVLASGLSPPQKRKFAIAVAKSYYDYLKEDAEKEDAIFFSAIANNFGIEFVAYETEVKVPLAKYLRLAPRDPHYKLVNREVGNGYVLVKRREFARLLEEAIQHYVFGRLIALEPPPQAKPYIKKLETALKLTEQQFVSVKVDENDYPPCIKAMLATMRAGENLPHIARWSLANYLLHANIAIDKIVDLFRTAPDFNEKTTRYQAEHLAKSKYSMPACETMKANGVCVAECGCGTPLRYRVGDEKRGTQ